MCLAKGEVILYITTPATPPNSANQSGFFIMSNIYNKPALTIDQQIDLLELRGLNIPDKEKARHYLQFINYYRLSGYTISFEQVIDGKRNHKLKNGTTFDNIIALYDFDRHLLSQTCAILDDYRIVTYGYMVYDLQKFS